MEKINVVRREVRYFFLVCAVVVPAVFIGAFVIDLSKDPDARSPIIADVVYGLISVFGAYPLFLLIRLIRWAFKKDLPPIPPK